MTNATFAAKAYPTIEAATSDNCQLIVKTAAKADEWRAQLPVPQQAYLETMQATLTPGACGLIPHQDGTPAFAYLVISDDVIWQAAQAAKTLPARAYRLDEDALDSDVIHRILLGFLMAQYQPEKASMKKSHATDVPEVARCHSAAQDAKTTRTNALAQGTMFTRDLINAPANKMTPATLADEATALAACFDASISVTSGEALASQFPAIHTVGRAAETQPCLIDMKWGNQGPKITLVGKGVTFDSGGLDLKPSKAMEMMKKDMGGAAHVMGLAKAIMMTGLPVQLRMLIGAAENAVSEASMRPMDVIDTRAGLAVEVGNTDAEGRLVLADCLTYALEDETPDFIVDFATLTGAARVALGTECPALFCNSDDTARAIMAAGQKEQDPLWQLPLFEPYDKQLDAGHMALSSTGSSGFGGAITAALFLRRFTGKQVNWAHIDVMAWTLSPKAGRPRGGEAMGLRALYHMIESLC